ncbi:MAG: hypothetical protein QG625_2407 [Cyanobacteriota bacterium erpe_2018_sw_39hr_WHONDRS-SW48-000098_B_bin.30]|jgi:hypothetical protein|nr:hypothetical protein [Cyanobacteriota bacterium erpe_2018_sw_39hr_WHONDRS-SW48-000098_B_bin.30]
MSFNGITGDAFLVDAAYLLDYSEDVDAPCGASFVLSIYFRYMRLDNM